MTCMDIKFINLPNVSDLYSDYVIVTREGANFSLKFYRQRPVMKEGYDVSDTGEVLGLEEEGQSFECILQSSLTISDFAAYHLINSLDRVGAKDLFKVENDE